MQTIHLPEPVKKILSIFLSAKLDIYIVGGAVRDTLMQKKVKDWDFATNAPPEKIQALFPDSFYDNKFGTVGVAGKHIGDMENPEEVYEITTYRSESAYSDHRRPDEVTWGNSIDEDLQRRDFTINAMAIGLANGKLTFIDPYHGKKDLEDKIIRAVGEASTRFQEDALRMMRGIRFSAQLGFTIELATLQAISKHSSLITHISWERIRDEFLKILVAQYSEEGMQLLYSTGLLQHILPELIEARGIEQSGHHIYDVWTHSLKALAECPSSDPIVRLATLLHDIAKPQTGRTEKKGKTTTITFYNHEVLGARIAKKVGERLRLSKSEIQRLFTLVRWHMFVYDRHMTDAYIRRFIRRVGKENINDMFDLRTADRVGSGSKRTSWRLEEMKKRVEEQFHQPFTLNDMTIDGNDVMRELKLQPSKEIGEILNTLFAQVLEDPTKNTREHLLGELHKFKKKKKS